MKDEAVKFLGEAPPEREPILVLKNAKMLYEPFKGVLFVDQGEDKGFRILLDEEEICLDDAAEFHIIGEYSVWRGNKLLLLPDGRLKLVWGKG